MQTLLSVLNNIWLSSNFPASWSSSAIIPDFLPHCITTMARAEEELNKLLLTKVFDKDRKIEVNKVWLC